MRIVGLFSAGLPTQLRRSYASDLVSGRRTTVFVCVCVCVCVTGCGCVSYLIAEQVISWDYRRTQTCSLYDPFLYFNIVDHETTRQKDSVSYGIAYRWPSDSCEKSWRRSPTAYGRQYHRRNYPFFGTFPCERRQNSKTNHERPPWTSSQWDKKKRTDHALHRQDSQ